MTRIIAKIYRIIFPAQSDIYLLDYLGGCDIPGAIESAS